MSVMSFVFDNAGLIGAAAAVYVAGCNTPRAYRAAAGWLVDKLNVIR